MYFPYFRGKQFELITIRETAMLLAKSDFVPIIEPVREALGSLERSLHEVGNSGGKAIVIVNPFHGDHADNGDGISKLLSKNFGEGRAITAGILLHSGIDPDSAVQCFNQHRNLQPTFVHAGFSEARALADNLGDALPSTSHVFLDNASHKLYRRYFKGAARRILVRDGFQRKKNAEYPPVEFFSDLHITFREEGMDGFGDFLIVGDDFVEGGGPAYAVAIHLTFIDPKQDDVMYVYHFVSTTRDTPTDPAGKFGQALKKLVEKLDSGTSELFEGDAIREFRELHQKGHFPGLGYVKKLSMKHHIETLADFSARENAEAVLS